CTAHRPGAPPDRDARRIRTLADRGRPWTRTAARPGKSIYAAPHMRLRLEDPARLLDSQSDTLRFFSPNAVARDANENCTRIIHGLQSRMMAASPIRRLPLAQLRAQGCQSLAVKGGRRQPALIIRAEDVHQTEEPVAGDQHMID